MTVRDLQLSVSDAPVEHVTARVHDPDRPSGTAFLLAHGAGGDLDSPGLVALAEGLAECRHTVVLTNLPYREAGRKAPPRAERSARWFPDLLRAARSEITAKRWITGGKSYGGRVASLAAADGMRTAGLLFYGYPLHPVGKPDKLRVSHWVDIPVPCLFLQGTRDRLCDLKLLEAHVGKLRRRATVHIVDGGDHSLKITAKASSDGKPHPPAEVLHGLADVVERWVATLGS